MKTLFVTLLFLIEVRAVEYNHPGQSSFVEFGYCINRSPYGYKVDNPYAVPKLVSGRFTWEAFRINYDFIDWGAFKIGPMVAYNFTPYGGDELAILAGMDRGGFIDFGGLVTIELPFGQLFLQAGKNKLGAIYKISLGTGLPLFAIGNNHLWLNLLLEWGYYDAGISNYYFGVRESEETAYRAAHNFSSMSYFSSIWGLWTPLGKNLWLNITYKIDNFRDDIMESPIISRDWDATLMFGIMYSFSGR